MFTIIFLREEEFCCYAIKFYYPRLERFALNTGEISMLKAILYGFLLVFIGGMLPLWAGDSTCTHNGIKLYGKVQVVDSFPDLKVQVVDSFPDLNVQFVNAFPDSCGKWQLVDSFPDFKIQYVNSFPDIKIKKVSSFPGK